MKSVRPILKALLTLLLAAEIPGFAVAGEERGFVWREGKLVSSQAATPVDAIVGCGNDSGEIYSLNNSASLAIRVK